MKKTRASLAMVAEDDAQFQRFWDAYPKRVSKKDARHAWAQLKPSAATVDAMVEALVWQSQQPAWVKDGGQFVPYPASWLRDERWTDEQPTALQVPSKMTTVLQHNAGVFADLTGRKRVV